MPELPPLARKLDDRRRRDTRLQRLRATRALLERVQAEYDLAFTDALKACSLGEVAAAVGMTRSGVQYHRRALNAGRPIAVGKHPGRGRAGA